MLNDIAYAQTVGDAGGGGALAQFLPLILIVVFILFFADSPSAKTIQRTSANAGGIVGE